MNTAHAVATVVRTSTTVFFLKVLELLQPDVIADVGSRDGREARLFRSVVPRARILACEANPSLAARMAQDDMLRQDRVDVVSCAVSATDGTATLHVADREVFNGSLHPWCTRATLQQVDVATRRLDRLITADPEARLALWIDVEGHAFEVLEGAGSLLDQVVVAHVEVETRPRWQGARLAGDIEAFMHGRGFRSAHAMLDRETGQGDIVFIHRRAGVTDAELCAKIARHAAYRPLATLANAARLKQRMPGSYALLKQTLGVFLKK
jgi:FkbM family methyltransferase